MASLSVLQTNILPFIISLGPTILPSVTGPDLDDL